MPRQCRISPSASRDLQEILDYFFERSIDAGEKFTNAFERKCLNISTFPNMGKSYGHLAPLLRGVPLDKYIILYVVTEDYIEITRVLSGQQDIAAQFSESG